VRDSLKRWDGEAIRLFAISAHYRSPIDFSERAMDEATERLERLYRAIDEANAKLKTHPATTVRIAPARGAEADDARALLESIERRFGEAMDDDFNTAAALSILFEAARALNRLTDRAVLTTGGPEGNGQWELATELRRWMKELGAHLGILGQEASRWLAQNRNAGLARLGITEKQIEKKIEEREVARKVRTKEGFDKADAIRKWLEAKGIILEDSPGGTTWRIA
jgi:cysteinyl-tRNA synthetase